MEVEFFYISWAQVENMAIRLAAKIQTRGIWGVPRGGSLVAAIMAYHGCKHIHGIAASRAVVVVDDIADSGKTLRPYRQETAALVVRYGCDYIPDYWVTMIDTKDYILFPWEDVKAIKLQEGFKTREG